MMLRLTVVVLLLFTIFSSCEKVVYQETFVNSPIKIGIENYTNNDFDSLKIFYRSRTGSSSFTWEDLVYYNIDSGVKSGVIEAQNLDIELFFRAYLQGDSLSRTWHCPDKLIDPLHPVPLPCGYYNFGIIECDTIEDELTVGLILYRFEC